METFTEKSGYKCEFCALKLEKYHLWSQHLCQFHNVVFLQCDYCRLKLPSKSELLNHVKNKHTDGRNPRVECSRCPATFQNTRGLDKHIFRKHRTNQPTFTCKKCGKLYKTRDTYHKHLNLAHKPLTYLKCDKCPKLFYRKQTLRRHKEVEHTENFQRTQCTMCPASYKYREHLSRHMQEKHFSVAKRKAGILNASLPSSENKCNICSALFEDKATLLEHRKTFHNRRIDIFHCNKCTAVFKIREAYENHLKEDHGIHLNEQLNEDKRDYVCQDYVDFEYTMLQHFELRQLMNVRKSRKFNQRLIIVTYNNETNEDEDNDSDDDNEQDISGEELKTITFNIKTLFDAVLSQYRNDPNISEINELPMQFYMGNEDAKSESNVKHKEVELESCTINQNNECILPTRLGRKNGKNNGRTQVVKRSTNPPEVCHDSTGKGDAVKPVEISEIQSENIEFPEVIQTVESNEHNESIYNKQTPKNGSSNPKNKRNEQSQKSKNTGEYCKPLNKKNIARDLPSPESSLKLNRGTKKIDCSKPNTRRENFIATPVKISYDNIKKNAKNSKSRFTCIKCNIEFETKIHLTKHKLKHCQLHECIHCSKSFKLKALLVRHIKSSHKLLTGEQIGGEKTETVDKMAKVDEQPGDANGSLMYQCEHCQALFPCMELLLNHCMWEHSNVNKNKLNNG